MVADGVVDRLRRLRGRRRVAVVLRPLDGRGDLPGFLRREACLPVFAKIGQGLVVAFLQARRCPELVAGDRAQPVGQLGSDSLIAATISCSLRSISCDRRDVLASTVSGMPLMSQPL